MIKSKRRQAGLIFLYGRPKTAHTDENSGIVESLMEEG
jgi:hypothetical protein